METKVIKNSLFFAEIASAVASGERVEIRAKGNSMLPFIRDGIDHIILEKPTQESFQKGRLLLFELSGSRYLMHRVKRVNGEQLLLQGDGNLSNLEGCTREQVIAQATAVIRGGKTIKEGSLRWNLFRYLWPSGKIARRVLLGLRRRLLAVSLRPIVKKQ